MDVVWLGLHCLRIEFIDLDSEMERETDLRRATERTENPDRFLLG
jgi:hypothetical protein